MAIELSPDAERWLARLPDIANAVLIALIALALAHLFWLLWPESTPQAVAPANTARNSRASNQNDINVDAIAGAHIFGQQKVVDIDQEKQKELNAPETHLNLTLTGIIAASSSAGSRALIKNPQGEQDSYRIGSSVVSGVSLHAIYPNKVILDRSGRFETLTLESLKKARSLGPSDFRQSSEPSSVSRSRPRSRPIRNESADSTASAPGASAGGGRRASSGDTGGESGGSNSNLANIRRQIMSNPSSAQRYIRLQPARQDGNLVGYRIFPGEDKALFEKAGLKSGELVTAINGQPLNNPTASLKTLGSLAHAQRATITVQDSDGQSRTVRVDF